MIFPGLCSLHIKMVPLNLCQIWVLYNYLLLLKKNREQYREDESQFNILKPNLVLTDQVYKIELSFLECISHFLLATNSWRPDKNLIRADLVAGPVRVTIDNDMTPSLAELDIRSGLAAEEAVLVHTWEVNIFVLCKADWRTDLDTARPSLPDLSDRTEPPQQSTNNGEESPD